MGNIRDLATQVPPIFPTDDTGGGAEVVGEGDPRGVGRDRGHVARVWETLPALSDPLE